jgi:predicted Zn-dependent protease with MMP-like domain
MQKEKFEQLVENALLTIPKKFRKILDNIAVIVERAPTRDVYLKTGSPPNSLILGVYHGVPYKHRGPFYGNLPPDVIVVFQEPIERICSTAEEIKEKVREVVIHEIAHYFGFKDDYLYELEKNKEK